MSAIEPVIGIGSSQRGWAAALTRFISDYGGARLCGTVITSQDAVDMDYDVLIVDDIASFLTPLLVERVQALGRRVLGVFDPEAGEAGADRLDVMGVDALVESEAAPDEMLTMAASLGASARTEPGLPPPDTPDLETTREPHITVVFGDDLATEVVLALADVLARRGANVVAADLDSLHPTLAQRLGLALVPNVLTALDAHTQRRGLVEESLVPTARGYLLLPGLPEAREWATVRSYEIADLIDTIARGATRTVVKLDSHLEDLSGLSARPGRFDVSRALLARAADAVVLTESTPLGLARTLEWVAQARTLSDAPIHVAFGRAPTGVYRRGELSEELTRSFLPASISWLPDDERVTRAAWNGAIVPPGSFLKAVAGLADRLGPTAEAAA